MPTAFCVPSSVVEAIKMRPSSSTSIWTPDSSTILRIIFPPGPMMSRILSTGIVIVVMRGAQRDKFGAAACRWSPASCSRMCRRPSLRLHQGAPQDLPVDAADLDVHLQGGDALARAGHFEVHVAEVHLRCPGYHVRIANVSPYLTRPIAIPATGRLIGTPASISAKVLPQTLAWEVEPFEERTSETRRIV